MTNEELVSLIQAGVDERENLGRLYEQNLRFLHFAILPYLSRWPQEEEDLLQEAYLGLYQAARRFRPEKGVLFLTYAGYWVRQAIRRHRGFQNPKDSSLEEPVPNAEGLTLGDSLSSGKDMESEAIDQIAQEHARKALWDAVDKLEGKEPLVIKAAYRDRQTAQEIGAALGEPEKDINRMKQKAIQKLRKEKSVRAAAKEMGLLSFSAFHWGLTRFRNEQMSSTEYLAMKQLEYEKFMAEFESRPEGEAI